MSSRKSALYVCNRETSMDVHKEFEQVCAWEDNLGVCSDGIHKGWPGSLGNDVGKHCKTS